MKQEELDNMWAETQLNADATKFEGRNFISIVWTIDINGVADIMYYFELDNLDDVLDDFQINNRCSIVMCEHYNFKRDVVYMCCALGTLHGQHYTLIEQYTYKTKYATPMR